MKPENLAIDRPVQPARVTRSQSAASALTMT